MGLGCWKFFASFDTVWLGVVINFAHCIPILFLLVLSIEFFHAPNTVVSNHNWAYRGISILSLVAIVGTIVMIGLGASNPNPNAIGVKSIADYFSIVILNMGTFLWLGTMLFARRGQAQAKLAVSE